MALRSWGNPLPVFAEMVTKGAPFSWGKSLSKASRKFSIFFCLFLSKSHLLTAKTTALPSLSAKSAIRKSCCSNGISASSKITTTSANFTALKPSLTESFSILFCTLAFFRIPAVSKNLTEVPFQTKFNEIASLVMPASGPVSKRSWPIILLINVDLPAFGRPMTAICKGFLLKWSSPKNCSPSK